MATLRVQIDLAFPLPLSATVETRLNVLKAEIKKAQAYAVKINSGKASEEMTVRAVYHVCRHDTGGPCDPEVNV